MEEGKLPSPVPIPPPKLFDIFGKKGKNGVRKDVAWVQGKYEELPVTGKRGKVNRNFPIQKLIDILSVPPPEFERVSVLEWYLLDQNHNRVRRVCGSLRYNLPSFVPDGIPNPHQVTNPRDQYRCTHDAGTATDHKGIGPCRYHSLRIPHTTNPDKVRPKRGNISFRELALHMSSGEASQMSQEDALIGLGNFDEYVRLAKEKYTPEELLDILRPLYEIEALKLQSIEHMKLVGFNEFDVDRISSAIDRSANIQLILAKRDETIARSNFIAMTLRVVLAGIVAILDQELTASQVVKIIERFEKDVILPLNDRGVTEVMQRQIAAGLHERVPIEQAKPSSFVAVEEASDG